MIFYVAIAVANKDSRRQKRRRPLESGQSDEHESKRTSTSLTIPSNRAAAAAAAATGSQRRLSTSSTPSISLSSSEDEPASSTQSHGINGNKTLISDTTNQQSSPSAVSIDQPQQRKRHQRKPTRQKPMQLSPPQLQSRNTTKEELGEIDDSSGMNEDNPIMSGKKSDSLLTTGGNSSSDLSIDNRTSSNNASTYKWLHQAFRSLMPPQSQINDIELSRQQNSSSPQSSNSSFQCPRAMQQCSCFDF